MIIGRTDISGREIQLGDIIACKGLVNIAGDNVFKSFKGEVRYDKSLSAFIFTDGQASYYLHEVKEIEIIDRILKEENR